MNMDTSYIDVIIQWLSEHDGAIDTISILRKPQMKPALQDIFHIFVALYAVVATVGTIANIAMLVVIVKRRLFHDATFLFLGNVGIFGLITAACVAPLTLTVLLMKNWIFGSLTCWLYPMAQTFPIYTTLMVFLVILIDRYIRARNLFQSKPTTHMCIALVLSVVLWIGGSALVVPFIFHVRFIDLGSALGKDFRDIGLCSVDGENEDVRKIHMVGLALLFCFCPVISAYVAFIIKMVLKRRMETQEELYEMKRRRSQEVAYYYGTSNAQSSGLPDTISIDSTEVYSVFYEHKLLNYLLCMVFLFAACWVPIIVITLAHQFDHKLEGTEGLQADIVHLSLMLLGFLSSWVVPIFFGFWRRAIRRYTTPPSAQEEQHV